MMQMKDQIRAALIVLIGKALWSSGSAALQWFQFGERRTVTGFRGDVKEVGEYALHVQCAWRITRNDRVVVGSSDPREESEQDNGDPQRKLSRMDDRVQQLFEDETRQFAVEGIEIGEAGAFSIKLADGYVLDVMPDDSSDCEHWRFFKPYVEGPHFVVTGAGLET